MKTKYWAIKHTGGCGGKLHGYTLCSSLGDAWYKDGYLFSYSHNRESFVDGTEIAFVHFFYNIEYTKLFEYKKFIELSLVDASVRFTDRTDEKSSVVYFPIEKVEGNYYDKILEKIMKELK